MKSAEEMRRALERINKGEGSALSQTNTTGSPALAGQPETITGQGTTISAPVTSSPASPSGGIASVESAPLSQDRTNESRVGAGDPRSNVDLVKHRGKPNEYMQRLILYAGPDQTLAQSEVSQKKSKTAMASDPEMTRLQAGRLGDATGITNDKQGEANRAAMENMFGKQFDRAVDVKVEAGEVTKKEGEKKKRKFHGIFADMDREEFSMWLWDWGGSMMANGEEGWAAVGVASQEATAMHRGRRTEQAALAVEEEERERKAALDERGMAAEESRAASALGVGDTMEVKGGVMERQSDGTWAWVKGPDTGEKVEAEFAADRPYRGEKAWLAQRYKAEGLDDATINDLITGARNPAERSQILQDKLGELKTEFTAKDSQGRYYREYTPEQDKEWILKQMNLADEVAQQYTKDRALDRALSEY
jgi:hypothetical protein